MKLSKFQQDKKFKQKKAAYVLHLEGLSTREIGKFLGKSRQWASDAIRLISTLKT